MIWLWLAGILVVIFGIVVFRGAPYVPSQKRYIKQAFTELYAISSSDVLIDIGSGDGVVLRQAAKLGARAVGYEINPILVMISRILACKQDLVTTKLADYWTSLFPDDVTVVYVFAVTRDVKKVVKKVQSEATRLKRPLKIISYGNKLPDVVIDKQVAAYYLYTILPEF